MIKDDELQSLQIGHRERLRRKFLDGKLTEPEILELLLAYAIPRRDVRVLSRQLYQKYGGIQQLLGAPFESLIDNDGIKENTATFFKLIHEIMKIESKSVLVETPIFRSFEQLCRYCKLVVGGKNIEEFHVLYLKKDFTLIKDDLHSSGTIDWAAVYVREIVKKALELNAYSVVLLHNHPTAGTKFSLQDVDITTEVENALNGLSITLYDHLLVSGDTVYSLRNSGFLNRRHNT